MVVSPIAGLIQSELPLLNRCGQLEQPVLVGQAGQAFNSDLRGVADSEVVVQRLRQVKGLAAQVARVQHLAQSRPQRDAQADLQTGLHGIESGVLKRLRARLQTQTDFVVAAAVNRIDLPRQIAHRAVLRRALWHALSGKPGPADRNAAANGGRLRQGLR